MRQIGYRSIIDSIFSICYTYKEVKIMFGNNLKRIRLEKGFSQSDIAKKLYVSRQCISKWENGITEPDLKELSQLSKILDVSIDILIQPDFVLPTSKQEKTFRNSGVLLLANCLVALFVCLFIIVIWRFVPMIIPAHYSNGIADRYGSKNEIFLHILTVISFFLIDILCFLIIRKTDKIKETANFILHFTILLFQISYLIFIIVLYVELITKMFPFITAVCLDLMLCVCIGIHPKYNKQNALFGVRTTATLCSRTIWDKVNAIASYILSVWSLILFVICMIFIWDYSFLLLFSYVIPSIVVLVYSIHVAKIKENIQ